MTIHNQSLYIERNLQGRVAHLDGLRGFAGYLHVVQHIPVPSKERSHLQVQIAHHVAEGIGVMLSAARHLLLSCL